MMLMLVCNRAKCVANLQKISLTILLPYWNFITVFQVHENGLIFFDDLTGVTAPQSINSIPFGSASFVAPYWLDNDPSSGGIISYEVHTGSSPLLRQVSQLIANNQGSQFCGTWMLVADWLSVPVHGEQFEDVRLS